VSFWIQLFPRIRVSCAQDQGRLTCG
jgi:hypothetical protein